MQESLHRSAQWNYLSRASRQARREGRRDSQPQRERQRYWYRIHEAPYPGLPADEAYFVVNMVPEEAVPDVERRRSMWRQAGFDV